MVWNIKIEKRSDSALFNLWINDLYVGAHLTKDAAELAAERLITNAGVPVNVASHIVQAATEASGNLVEHGRAFAGRCIDSGLTYFQAIELLKDSLITLGLQRGDTNKQAAAVLGMKRTTFVEAKKHFPRRTWAERTGEVLVNA